MRGSRSRHRQEVETICELTDHGTLGEEFLVFLERISQDALCPLLRVGDGEIPSELLHLVFAMVGMAVVCVVDFHQLLPVVAEELGNRVAHLETAGVGTGETVVQFLILFESHCWISELADEGESPLLGADASASFGVLEHDAS